MHPYGMPKRDAIRVFYRATHPAGMQRRHRTFIYYLFFIPKEFPKGIFTRKSSDKEITGKVVEHIK
jgi:hypothetical protein